MILFSDPSLFYTAKIQQYNTYGLLVREIVSPRCCKFGKSHLTTCAHMCETKRSYGDKGTPYEVSRPSSQAVDTLNEINSHFLCHQVFYGNHMVCAGLVCGTTAVFHTNTGHT